MCQVGATMFSACQEKAGGHGESARLWHLHAILCTRTVVWCSSELLTSFNGSFCTNNEEHIFRVTYSCRGGVGFIHSWFFLSKNGEKNSISDTMTLFRIFHRKSSHMFFT